MIFMECRKEVWIKGIVILVLAVGFWLRYIYMVSVPLTVDEKINIEISRNLRFSIIEPLPHVYQEYYSNRMMLLSTYARKIGSFFLHEGGVDGRVINMFFSCLTLIFFYFFAKEYGGVNTAAIALFLLAVNTFHISNSVMAGENACMLFFALVSFWSFLKAKESRQFLLLSGFFSGLGYWAHERSLLLLPIFFIIYLMRFKEKKVFKDSMLFVFPMFLALLPYLLQVILNNIIFFNSKHVRLNFVFPSLTGLNFYLLRLFSFITGQDYKLIASWEWPTMTALEGCFLFFVTLGSLREKNKINKEVSVLFFVPVIVFSFIEGEAYWAELSLIASVFLTASMIAKKIRNFYILLIMAVIFLVNSFLFIADNVQGIPPGNLAPLADYNYDLMSEIYLKEDLDAAIKEGKKSLEVCPNELRGLYYLGKAHFDKREYFLAAKYWIKALDIEPAYSDVNEVIRDNFNLLFNKTKQHLLKKKERQNEINYVLGALLLFNDGIGQAEHYILEGISISNEFDESKGYYYLAKAAYLKKDFKKAIDLVNKSLNIDSLNFLTRYLKGNISEKQNNFLGALDSYNAALSLNPHYYSVYKQIIKIKLKFHDRKGALRTQWLSRHLVHNCLLDDYEQYFAVDDREFIR